MNAKESLYNSLPDGLKKEIDLLISTFSLTEQIQLELIKNEADLHIAGEESLRSRLDMDAIMALDKGARRSAFIKAMRKEMTSYFGSEIDYSSFHPGTMRHDRISVVREDIPLGFGKCPCPVDGEETRCCKLKTLDVITQCAFSCSYCSVQAFYDENRIRVVDNLAEKLNALKLDDSIWHIGTGQASDSLFLGNDYNTLNDLSDFAEKHPNTVIELKSKSKRDVFDRKYPRNIIFTWSLNAPSAIEKEERGTALLPQRLAAAEKARDNGSLVGFHIHPMIRFRGWEEEYHALAREIESRFDSKDILMISSGTLTFTKENLRFIREHGVSTRVLQMPKAPVAGKYSYTFEQKKEMFSHLFSSFSKNFLSGIFTYLCLEDPRLWLPVLGREYKCDRDFESDMREKYLAKITSA